MLKIKNLPFEEGNKQTGQGQGYAGLTELLLKSLGPTRKAQRLLHPELRPCNIARSMTAENNHYGSRLLHLRLPRVCVAIAGSDANEMLEKAEALARDNPFIELRLLSSQARFGAGEDP